MYRHIARINGAFFNDLLHLHDHNAPMIMDSICKLQGLAPDGFFLG